MRTRLLGLGLALAAIAGIAAAAPPADAPHGVIDPADDARARRRARDPNDLTDGVLIAHHPPGLLYSSGIDYCATYASHAITSCEEENPRIDTSSGVVWYVLAAWDLTDKTYSGVEFGLGDYDPDALVFAAHGQCPVSALTIPFEAWPGPNSGISMAAAGEPWSGNYLPVYWFATYAYSAGQVPLTLNPGTGFGGFANCETPPISFPAVCFGSMGLFEAGTACCPPAPVMHVCCLGETCQLLVELDCAAAGGVFHPEWDSCLPNPCVSAPDDLGGGVLITHFPPGLLYTDEGLSDRCLEYPQITHCDQQNPRIDEEAQAVVWYVLAAWGTEKTWCGVEFGLGDYAPSSVRWMEYGPCPSSALTIPSPTWPGPNSGVAVASPAEPWEGNYRPVYSFACYAYEADRIPLTASPVTGFAGFCNCLIPPVEYQATCLGAMGLFQDGEACCPPPYPPRVCCVNEVCRLLLEDECLALGGVWHEGWNSCVPNLCIPHVCCVGGQCLMTLADECQGLGGTWHAGWDSCTPDPCLLRACCRDGDCLLISEALCLTLGGVWHPEWDTCDPNPCIPHVCCVGDNCYLTTETDCQALGGVWHSDWEACEPNPCLPHVCCIGETCAILHQDECQGAGGVWHPAWESCDPNPCLRPHVCCVGEVCHLILQTECETLGGVWHPEWNSCANNPCALPHVCCIGDDCHLLLQGICQSMGGEWHPTWNSCDPNPCLRPHVCCVEEICYLVFQEDCEDLAGIWHPTWDACAPNPCARPHVCCVGEACALVFQPECDAAGGAWHPEWDSCSPNPCLLAACCTGSDCVLLEQTECEALGGVWMPGHVSCMPNPCLPTLRVCPDGSEPFLTIQAAVDAAVPTQGIVLCDGLYQGDGNRDVVIDGKPLGIASESGDPQACRIECEGRPEAPHRAFDIRLSEGLPVVLAGLTIEGGCVADDGGAVRSAGGVPTFLNCRIVGNQAANGGGIACGWNRNRTGGRRDPTPEFSRCVFSGNRATLAGGGLYLDQAPSSAITRCTFSGNLAGSAGGGVRARLASAALSVTSCILWEDCATEAAEVHVAGTGAGATFIHCDIAPAGVGGPGPVTWGEQNVNVDPWFCAPEPCDIAPTPLGDYRLSQNSPLVTHTDTYSLGRRGALEVGCEGRAAAPDEALEEHGLWLTLSAPGPEGGTTRIRYAIAPGTAGPPITLRVFDSAGRLVRTFDDIDRTAGIHEIAWDATDLHGQALDGGVYFCRLEAGSHRVTSRLVLVR